MRGSMVEGKFSSSPAAWSKEDWMRARSSAVSCARSGLPKRRRQSNYRSAFLNIGPPLPNGRGSLGPREEDRQTQLLRVSGAGPVGVVHGGYLHAARPQLGIRNRHYGVAAIVNGAHQPMLAFDDGVHGHARESGCHHAVHKVGAAGAQIVGQVAHDGLIAGGGFDLIAE